LERGKLAREDQACIVKFSLKQRKGRPLQVVYQFGEQEETDSSLLFLPSQTEAIKKVGEWEWTVVYEETRSHIASLLLSKERTIRYKQGMEVEAGKPVKWAVFKTILWGSRTKSGPVQLSASASEQQERRTLAKSIQIQPQDQYGNLVRLDPAPDAASTTMVVKLVSDSSMTPMTVDWLEFTPGHEWGEIIDLRVTEAARSLPPESYKILLSLDDSGTIPSLEPCKIEFQFGNDRPREEIMKMKFRASQEKGRWAEELKQPRAQKKSKDKLIQKMIKKRDTLISQLRESKLKSKPTKMITVDQITTEIKSLQNVQKEGETKAKAPADKWLALKDKGYIGRICDIIACRDKEISRFASFCCQAMMMGHVTIGKCQAATHLDNAKAMLLGLDEIKNRKFPPSLGRNSIKWLVRELSPNPDVKISRENFEKLVMRSNLRSVILAKTKQDAIRYKQETQTECLLVAMEEGETLAMFRNGPQSLIPTFSQLKLRFGVVAENADWIQNDISLLEQLVGVVNDVSAWEEEMQECEERLSDIQQKMATLQERVRRYDAALKKPKILEEDVKKLEELEEGEEEMQDGDDDEGDEGDKNVNVDDDDDDDDDDGENERTSKRRKLNEDRSDGDGSDATD